MTINFWMYISAMMSLWFSSIIIDIILLMNGHKKLFHIKLRQTMKWPYGLVASCHNCKYDNLFGFIGETFEIPIILILLRIWGPPNRRLKLKVRWDWKQAHIPTRLVFSGSKRVGISHFSVDLMKIVNSAICDRNLKYLKTIS